MSKLLNALITFALFVSAVYSQANSTCTAFKPTDNACGFLAPATSLFFEGQATTLSANYGNQLSIICGGELDSETRKHFPLVFCLGAMGPCNDASFTLPEVNENGIPTDIQQVGAFYNSASFSQLLPAIEAAGATPPCYESCSKAVMAVKGCAALASLFQTDFDLCEGLPTENGPIKCTAYPSKQLSEADKTNNESTPSNTATRLSAGFLVTFIMLLVF